MYSRDTFLRAYFKYLVYCNRYKNPNLVVNNLMTFVNEMNYNLHRPFDATHNSRFIYDFYNVESLEEFDDFRDAINTVIKIVKNCGTVQIEDYDNLKTPDTISV